MPKEVIYFQTADGKTHPTSAQARRHEKDMLCRQIDLMIQAWFPTGHAPSTHKVVEGILENKEIFHTDIKALDRMMEFMKDNP